MTALKILAALVIVVLLVAGLFLLMDFLIDD